MIGQTLGHCRILARIGAGGMGEVYRAHDAHLDRDVAIKVLPPGLLTDELARKRFRKEAEALSKLNHPNIAVVHDFDAQDGVDYLVMEFVPGESLDGKLKAGPLSEKECIELGEQIAAALEEAHEHGVIHRDLKPSNVMVTPKGQAKVLDFGLAKLLRPVTEDAPTASVTQTQNTAGTLPYMAPEQLRGEPADARTDIWAAGVVLYEMATGRRPFEAKLPTALAADIQHEPVTPPSQLNPESSPRLEEIILKCLEKDPALRYQSAQDLLVELLRLAARAVEILPRQEPRGSIWWAWRIGVGAVVLAMLVAGVRLWVQQSRATWARTIALPEATRLMEQGRTYAAFRTLRRAEAYLPGDPLLKELLAESTTQVTILTEPLGADIYVRDFFDDPEGWEFLGRSPIEAARLSVGSLVFKVSREGFQTNERLGFTRSRTIQFSLQPVADAPAGMVLVPGGRYELFSRPAVQLDNYWVDKFEVTNRQFKEFVDRGGYEKREYWAEPFVKEGVAISWEEARALFRDRTGRPGPATWELGTYPDGADDYPARGVSWYEAAAYCASISKQLPTIYHWYQAADLQSVTEFTPFSNFAAAGPERVGQPLHIGSHGTYDMAGNVKEWAWNQADPIRRYILGGSWNEPSYMFRDYDAQRSFDREATYGFRCAKYRRPLAASLMDRVEAPSRDYRRETPVGDEAFALYESLYRYDRAPLDVRVESVDDSFEHWRIERVSFAAAYGNERVPALLFLPKNSPPPYQTVVWFPAAGAFNQRSGFYTAHKARDWFLFLVRSGRAVFVPMYKGTYERHIGDLTLPHVWRDIMIHSAKDLARAIDYLETRPDIDASKVAYYGLSSGAGVGPIMTAVEPRFKASILLGGGLYFWRRPPESEAFNFLPRVKVPTLMINGWHDFYFPVETSQDPMFRLLGTPPADKRHAIFESGHVPTERQKVIKEILDWLDRYLGPVSRP